MTNRLRLGFGIRFEREGGTTERFNRGLAGTYDPAYVPSYASAVQGAYASLIAGSSTNPAIQTLQQGMPANSFQIAGGVTYLGTKYPNYTSGTTRFLPNFSAVYEINDKTVLRFGTGLFGDAFNALSASSTRAPQNGFSQSTTTTISNDNGLTFCCGVGAAANLGPRNPLMDPFPVLASGSRFVTPAGNTLGSDILAGQGFTSLPRDYTPSFEQRYSLGIQRALSGNQMIEVSYNGGYASVPLTQNLSALPAQYWNYSNSYSAATDTR